MIDTQVYSRRVRVLGFLFRWPLLFRRWISGRNSDRTKLAVDRYDTRVVKFDLSPSAVPKPIACPREPPTCSSNRWASTVASRAARMKSFQRCVIR